MPVVKKDLRSDKDQLSSMVCIHASVYICVFLQAFYTEELEVLRIFEISLCNIFLIELMLVLHAGNNCYVVRRRPI